MSVDCLPNFFVVIGSRSKKELVRRYLGYFVRIDGRLQAHDVPSGQFVGLLVVLVVRRRFRLRFLVGIGLGGALRFFLSSMLLLLFMLGFFLLFLII